MKKVLLGILLVLAACTPSQVITTVPPTEIINQYPTPMPTPTLAVITKTIEEDREEALNFFHELKNNMALGEYEHVAEEVRYPITARVDGQPRSFVYVAEFEENFEKVFTEEIIRRFISTDESELTFTPTGVKVAGGIMWFDLICLDADCEEAEFLITEINN